MYSPRMWRWSPTLTIRSLRMSVFSTYVEVIPTQSGMRITKSCILHVCGGDPGSLVAFEPGYKYSPRMWRWSYHASSAIHTITVFSTYVEVILLCKSISLVNPGILHVCGGDPKDTEFSKEKMAYSPRMWRWSFASLGCLYSSPVFSTYVEVIPSLPGSTQS